MLVKINLGCGEKWVHDWVNIDWSWNARIRKHPIAKVFVPLLQYFGWIDTSINWPPDLVLHDIRKKLPFKDETVDYIYAAHVLEHLRKYEAIEVLKDCHRILKAKGIIRIVVPDLELFALKYVTRDYDFYYKAFTYGISNRDTFADRFLAIFYDEKSKQQIKSKLKSKLFPVPYHQWMYDFDLISFLLRDVGFKSIEKLAPRVGKVPDILKLEDNAPENLYIEAQK